MASIPVILILVSLSVLGVVLLGMLLLLILAEKRKTSTREEMDTVGRMFCAPCVLPDSTPWCLEQTACIPIQPRIYEDLQRSEDENTLQEYMNVPENVAGKLEFSLQYDSQRSILLLTLHKAHGLQDENQNDVTHCVTIQILPQIHRSFQSAAVTGTNPEFQELYEFCVPYETLLEQQLKFSVSHFDRFSRHEFTGDVMVHLAELEHRGLYLSREILLVRTINAVKKTSGDLGELLFALTYFPLTERLNIDVMKAKDLPLGDDGQKPDPYVKVLLFDAGREVKWARTATLKNIFDPTYNDRLVFHVSMATLHKKSLMLCVMHDEQGRCEDKWLGRVFLGPEATGSQFEHWNEMRMTSNKPTARWHKLFQ